MEKGEKFEEPELAEKIQEEKVELGIGSKPEKLAEKKPEDIEIEIQKLVKEVEQAQDKAPEPKVAMGPKAIEERVGQYQRRYVPDYLKDKKENGALLSHALDFFIGNRYEKKGEENLPEKGPFLVLCNHFGGETGPLLATLKNYDTHIAAAKNLNWDRSPFRKWLLGKMRAISVDESLGNLSEEEKDELIARAPRSAKKGYQKIVEREKEGKQPTNIQFIHESVALLSRGDVVAVFPEGLFLYEEQKALHQGYGGMELIAKHYKDLTGKDLPILPIAVYKEKENNKKTISIGEPFNIEDNRTDTSGADWCMGHIAKLLPENQRGYYSELNQ